MAARGRPPKPTNLKLVQGNPDPHLNQFLLPLLVCAVVCATFQIIYYRPRYVVLLLPYFLIGMAIACRSLRRPWQVGVAMTATLSLMTAGTVAQERSNQKKAWRKQVGNQPMGEYPL